MTLKTPTNPENTLTNFSVEEAPNGGFIVRRQQDFISNTSSVAAAVGSASELIKYLRKELKVGPTRAEEFMEFVHHVDAGRL